MKDHLTLFNKTCSTEQSKLMHHNNWQQQSHEYESVPLKLKFNLFLYKFLLYNIQVGTVAEKASSNITYMAANLDAGTNCLVYRTTTFQLFIHT